MQYQIDGFRKESPRTDQNEGGYNQADNRIDPQTSADKNSDTGHNHSQATLPHPPPYEEKPLEYSSPFAIRNKKKRRDRIDNYA